MACYIRFHFTLCGTAVFTWLKTAGIGFEKDPYRNRHTGRANARLRDPDGWRLQLCDQKRKEPERGIDEDSVVADLE